MKKFCKRMVAVGIFGMLLIGMLWRTNNILRVKGFSAGYSMETFYRQTSGTVDVLNLGNSHMFANVNPAILWDEYGITAFDLGAGLQPLWNTYFYMDEALKYQTPKVIVVDLFGAVQTTDYLTPDRTAMNTLGLAYSETSKENIAVSVGNENDYMDYILKYPIYHNRYQDLEEGDFRKDEGDINYANYKGYALNCISTTSRKMLTDVSGVSERKPLTQKNEKYLKKIIEKAKSVEIPILLTVNPYADITYEDKKIYNEVEKIALKYNVDFIDFNEFYEKIGLDPMRDFAEGHHLNYYGAEKFSSYLGEYLVKHYNLSSHKGESGYETWQANSEFYTKQAENIDLIKTTDEAEYLRKIFENQKRYTICLSCDGNYYQEGRTYLDILAEQGLNVWNEHIWVIKNGEIVYHTDKRTGVPEFKLDLGKCSVAIVNRKLNLGTNRAEVVTDGLNVLVYDNELQVVVDVCGMDASQEGVIRERQL